jgi:hypothetical protein
MVKVLFSALRLRREIEQLPSPAEVAARLRDE